MTPDNFVSEIYSRYPYKGTKTEDELSSIRVDLLDFAFGKSPSFLKSVVNEFRSMKPPKGFGMWWFYQKVKSEGSGVMWWRICDNGHKYQDRGATCPVCSSYDFVLDNGDIMPSDTIEIQDSCSACTWYKESLSNPMAGLYGNSCHEYGTEKHGKIQECGQCKCIECCKMSYLYTHNPAEYKNMMGGLLERRYKETGLEWAKK